MEVVDSPVDTQFADKKCVEKRFILTAFLSSVRVYVALPMILVTSGHYVFYYLYVHWVCYNGFLRTEILLDGWTDYQT